MNHPNLSADINANLSQSERDGGVWLKDIPDNCMVEVQTKNTLYQIRHNPDKSEWWQVKGHAKYCPDWTDCRIHGSTWGSSMIKVGFIGINMYLELTLLNTVDWMFSGTITTIQIREVWVK